MSNDLDGENKPLVFSPEHADACHARWYAHRNNLKPDQSLEDMTDEENERWANEQCGGCRYCILLMGALFRSDWGVCSNAASQFDGRVMFEHDGCDQYSAADYWVSEYFPRTEAEQDAV